MAYLGIYNHTRELYLFYYFIQNLILTNKIEKKEDSVKDIYCFCMIIYAFLFSLSMVNPTFMATNNI